MARLTRDEWIDAAYEVFGAEGLAAVRVEPIARAMGTTKGSFYWHFADRRDLQDAVLERWRELETERIIRELDTVVEPVERLDHLLLDIAHRQAERQGERTLYVDARALGVEAAVADASVRRIEYLASVLHAIGLAEDESRRRATIIVATVLGYQQLDTAGWSAGEGVGPRALVDTLRRLAVSGTAFALPDTAVAP